MKTEVFQYFFCPSCRGRLSLKEPISVHNNIEGGILVCTSCNRKYPIINYIPRFSQNDNYSRSFRLQWSEHRKTQKEKGFSKSGRGPEDLHKF